MEVSNLDEFKVEPEVPLSTNEAEMRTAIRSGKVHTLKTRSLVELSRAVLEKFGGNLT